MGSLRSLQGLGESLPGLDRYAERALLLAGEGDVVCVPRPVDACFLEFLSALGLGPRPEHIVVPNGNGRNGELDAYSCVDVVACLGHHDGDPMTRLVEGGYDHRRDGSAVVDERCAVHRRRRG